MTNDNTVPSPEDIIWIRNENGGVHDVTRAHANEYLYEVTNAGRRFMLPGFSIITEAEAKAQNPQLFGAHDPNIIFTNAEMAAKVAKTRLESEMLAD